MGDLLDFLFDDDEEEPKGKNKKSGGAKKPRPGGGPKPPPKKLKTAAGGPGNPNPSQGGTSMSRLATIAGTATGNNKAKKMKDVVNAFEATAEAAEEEIPGIEVEVIVNGNVIVGDVEGRIRALYDHFTGDNGVALTEDNVTYFVNLCVVAFGDNKEVRKTAKAVYEKKGA